MSNAKERPRRGGTARLTPDDTLPQRGEGRRTERLAPDGDEWSQREPVNPGWRSERVGQRRSKGALPASPQEFQLWLQAGGWRYLAGIGILLIVLLIAVLAYSRNDKRATGVGFGQEEAAPTSAIGAQTGMPTILPAVTSAPPTAVAPATKSFIVTGTGIEGLLLRPEPSRDKDAIGTLPDGTRVEQIGDDVTGGDYVWRHIRAPDGKEGWVAIDFLVPAP